MYRSEEPVSRIGFSCATIQRICAGRNHWVEENPTGYGLAGQSASIRKFLLPMIPPLVSRQPIKLQAAASVLHSSDYWTFSDFSGDANMGGGHLREIRCHDSKERAASCGQFPALVASCIPRIEFLSALENT
ncbi:hypothetical protein BDBG_02059 [Blastomyces gilchristii SLH14081]|uniref:Uncharacterized protein n=1 Tax=Blastomyces gilchristii (strain SLH14081) TaxID=559298 RepID=A0A179UEK4_BLAGS|nr:uncharacterized protein BDBG_02059 [Blastomyces gilchristii SLH14081]OAT05718.1 hypothetical protein BDBG_02059 [Blastomyces gilchristii SLH14081]